MSESGSVFIVLAGFLNESASVGALAGLEHWADTQKEIELGAVGALQNVNGELNAEIVHEAGKGALVSGAMGLAKTLLGPVALVGNVLGGIAKSVFAKPDEETPEALNKLAEQMDAGGVTLVLVCPASQVNAFQGQLQAMCGTVSLLEIPEEVLEQAAAAVEAAEAQEEAKKQEEKEQKKAEKEQKKEEKKEEKDK